MLVYPNPALKMLNFLGKQNFGISLVMMLLAMMCPGKSILAQDSSNMTNASLKIECADTVSANSKVFVNYILDYKGEIKPEALELKASDFKSDCARFLFMAKSATRVNCSVVNKKKTVSNQVRWTAVIKTTKVGCFQTPDVVLLCGKDTLSLTPIPRRRTIVVKDDTGAADAGKTGDDAIVKLVTFLDKREQWQGRQDAAVWTGIRGS